MESLFKKLQIKCIADLNNLNGFIDNENNLYTINFEKKRITIGNKSINISGGVLEEMGVKYIKASLLYEAFGLNFVFNPRTLTAKLKSNFELAFFKKLKREQSREKLSKLTKKQIIDTIIPRNYHLFRFGTMDWGINSSQGNDKESNTSINMIVGTEFLFGQANFNIEYTAENKFDFNNIRADWRWVNNNKKIIKQALIGSVAGPSGTRINSNIIGATINNTPNEVREATGSYTITDTTEPNWNVELYINDVLIDYTQADAAGLYLFKVPIVFGLSVLKLKFYGPLGEVREEERLENNPYTVVPVKKLEYSLTAGIVQDTLKSRFGKIKFNYGITRLLTIAGALEYLSSNTTQPIRPIASATFRPFSAVLLSVDYMHKENIIGLLNYYITNNAFLNINYTHSIQASNFGIPDRLEIKLSTPYKNKFFSGFTRISFSQNKFKEFNYNSIDLSVSSSVNKVKINSNLFINWISERSAQINTNLALSYRLAGGLSLQSSTAYNFTSNNFNFFNINLQKRISKLNLSCSYQRDIQTKTSSINVSANYALPFSNVGISSSYNGNSLNFKESARGSMAFDTGNTPIHVGNNSAIGKGGLLLHPFLDLNANGKLDRGEKRILISSVKVQGAKAVISKKDSIIRIFDLNAFINYTVEFSDTNLDNIAWRLKHKTYKILVDPNQYKRVFIPVISVGEISGIVSIRKDKSVQGQGRITVQILDEKGAKVTEILSEFDGYYSYLGLKPGKYTVRVDETQLKNLNYKALPKLHQITIKVSEYGDIIDDLDFTLSKKAPKKPKE